MSDKVGNWGIHVKWMSQYFRASGIKIGGGGGYVDESEGGERWGERHPNILISGSHLALSYISIMQQCQKIKYAADCKRLERLIILGKLFECLWWM